MTFTSAKLNYCPIQIAAYIKETKILQHSKFPCIDLILGDIDDVQFLCSIYHDIYLLSFLMVVEEIITRTQRKCIYWHIQLQSKSIDKTQTQSIKSLFTFEPSLILHFEPGEAGDQLQLKKKKKTCRDLLIVHGNI